MLEREAHAIAATLVELILSISFDVGANPAKAIQETNYSARPAVPAEPAFGGVVVLELAHELNKLQAAMGRYLPGAVTHYTSKLSIG